MKATTKSLKEPDSSVCVYHGFVLGLMVDLADKYSITSNRKSGFGRYDVLPEKGFPAHRIRKYGFAFSGKQVLIGASDP